MKKELILIIVSIFIISYAFASEKSEKGKKQVNVVNVNLKSEIDKALVPSNSDYQKYIIKCKQEKRQCVDFDSWQNNNNQLLLASRDNDFNLVKKLLDSGNVNIDARGNSDGKTALILAALKNNEDIAKLLLQRNANVHILDFGGRNALMTAAWQATPKIVNLILQKKDIDINAKYSEGENALMIAANIGEPENFETVRLLVEAGAVINETDNKGETALMKYVQHGDIGIVKLLLQHGANQDIESKNKQTALIIAKRNEDKKIINLLNQWGNYKKEYLADAKVRFKGLRQLLEPQLAGTGLLPDLQKIVIEYLGFIEWLKHMHPEAFKEDPKTDGVIKEK